MMGRQTADQARPFYEFHLDERVPADPLLRRIGVFVAAALGDLRQKLADHYSYTGHHRSTGAAHPHAHRRLLLWHPSERRLCEEVVDRLTFRWFCRLDLDDQFLISTFSKNRHGRFRDSDVLRHIFEWVVLACITAGLVGGEGFAVDASLIEADANKGRSIPGAEWSKERDPATDPAGQWTGAMKSAAIYEAARDVARSLFATTGAVAGPRRSTRRLFQRNRP